MIVKELFKKIDFDEFFKELSSYYLRTHTPLGTPYTKEELDRAYKNTKKSLEEMIAVEVRPNKERMIFVVMQILDTLFDEEEDEEDSRYTYDASGFKPEDEELYALALTDWEESLGYEVADISIEKYGEAATAAHIYWELTFFGISKESRDNECDSIKASLEEAQNDIDTSNYKTLEDFYKEIGYVDERTEEQKEKERQQMQENIEENNKIKEVFMEALRKQAETLK